MSLPRASSCFTVNHTSPFSLCLIHTSVSVILLPSSVPKVSAHLRLVIVLHAWVHVQRVPDANLLLFSQCHEVGHKFRAGRVVVEVSDDVTNTINEHHVRLRMSIALLYEADSVAREPFP